MILLFAALQSAFASTALEQLGTAAQLEAKPPMVQKAVPVLWPFGGGPAASKLKSGDLIFHKSKSAQSAAIALVTGSGYTHVGVVYVSKGGAVSVYEAVGPVRMTSFEQFVSHGEGGSYSVKRYKGLTEAQVSALRQAGAAYGGRPYDSRFRWDEGSIYCSELVWKMFKKAGITLGSADGRGLPAGRLKPMVKKAWDRLSGDPRYRSMMEARWGGPAGIARIPDDEPVVSPGDLHSAWELSTVW